MATTNEYTYEVSSRAMTTGILNYTVTESEHITPYILTSVHENINDLTKTTSRPNKYRRKPFKASTPKPWSPKPWTGGSYSRNRIMREI